MVSSMSKSQWRSQGGAKGAIAPPFFEENALGVEQSVTL